MPARHVRLAAGSSASPGSPVDMACGVALQSINGVSVKFQFHPSDEQTPEKSRSDPQLPRPHRWLYHATVLLPWVTSITTYKSLTRKERLESAISASILSWYQQLLDTHLARLIAVASRS